MSFIDKTTYNKVRLYPPEKFDQFHRGYAGIRILPKSIVVHTTNGKKGTLFENEAKFIYESQDISAHYLVGKDGRIVEFLSPHIVAYHAGAIWPAYKYFGNPYSIGIECHHAVGETWTLEQKKALFDLCRILVRQYTITLIETHRRIAKPNGRKIDPSDFPDSEFYPFVKRIFFDTPTTTYITTANTNVRSTPSTTAKILKTVPKGSSVVIAEIVTGELYRRNDKWCRLIEGGFIWKDLLRIT